LNVKDFISNSMKACAMTAVVETSRLIEECRRELKRLNHLVGEFRTANEISRNFLTGARKVDMPNDEAVCWSVASRLNPGPNKWRERGEQTRTFAELVDEPRAKRLLLEIAVSYDQMAE
jgi:hypothetical protein